MEKTIAAWRHNGLNIETSMLEKFVSTMPREKILGAFSFRPPNKAYCFTINIKPATIQEA